MQTINVVSVSGGKDSTATLLTAIERGAENIRAVFADTGHEHPQTLDYVKYLSDAVGIQIEWIKTDFSHRIELRRQHIQQNWFGELTAGFQGHWKLKPGADDPDTDFVPPPQPPVPIDPFISHETSYYQWKKSIRPMTAHEAEDVIERALAVLHPTGIPFLDLILWKGRFPSTKTKFCTQFLKREPFQKQIIDPLLASKEFERIVSWVGIRRDESLARAEAPEWQMEFGDAETGAGLWLHQPLVNYTAEDVFAMRRRHGIKWNPLYEQGMGRVGCMPCINARKGEMREIARRFPEEIERVAEWERITSKAAKYGCATFWPARGVDDVTLDEHGIHSVVEWSRTTRGGKQYDLIGAIDMEKAKDDEPISCQSIYGLCE